MRDIGVLTAGRGLKQAQGLPRELVQVGGADIAAALGLRTARWQDSGCRELIKKQSREARILRTARDKGAISAEAWAHAGSLPPSLALHSTASSCHSHSTIRN